MYYEASSTASSNSSSSRTIPEHGMDIPLKSYFGHNSLRIYQKEAIDNILQGRDCFVVMATGAGKSICYQLPPLVSKKTSIVVSPLLALMQDQVMSLNHKGITADYLGSTQTNRSVTTNAENGLYDVLFLTPEKAMSLPNIFWEKINKHGVCLFAVDEAHCISEWGPDFRQDYKMLHELRHKLPGVPYVALTATATDRVREDIIKSLKLSQPFVSIGSFDRPNIFYSVTLIRGSCRVQSFLDLITLDVQRRYNDRESTIIYCLTIRDTQDVYDALTAVGVSCAMYHGQMDRFMREKSHKQFVSNTVLVMVATIAFGMGIDKPDVRCVIHFGCPKSLESYYQESGRCGRDGLASSACLYYSRADFTKGGYYCADITSETHKQAIMASFLAAQKYCMIGSCRRRELLNYFGEDSSANCGNCDNCNNTQVVHKDLFEEAVLLLCSIKDCGCRWGFNMPINVIRGCKAKKIIENEYHLLPGYGQGKSHSAQWWKCLASILISHGYIDETSSGSFRIARLTQKGKNLIQESTESHRPLILRMPQEMIDEEFQDTSHDSSNDIIDEPPAEITVVSNSDECTVALNEGSNDFGSKNNDEFQLFQMLLKVRSKLAAETSVTPDEICGDDLLVDIAKTRPSNVGHMALLTGVTKAFLDCFSVIFLHHVRETCEDNNLSLDNFDLDFLGDFTQGSAQDQL